MALKNVQVGSFFYNLLRDPATVINIVARMTAGVVHLRGFGDTELTTSQPGFLRFDGNTCYAITDDYAVRDATVSSADTFGLPADYVDCIPLYVGIGEIAGDEVTVLLSRSRPTSVTMTVTTGNATDADFVLSAAAQAVAKAIWIGAFVGQSRTAGVWDWSGAEYIDARYI